MRWLDSVTDAMNMNLGELQEMTRDGEALYAAVHGVTKSRTWLGDWTTTKGKTKGFFLMTNQESQEVWEKGIVKMTEG